MDAQNEPTMNLQRMFLYSAQTEVQLFLYF